MQSINIPSSINHICEVEYFLNDIFKEFRFARKIYCKIYLATTEAVNNAIIHGNKLFSEKKVVISFEDLPDYYLLKIADEGKGFDYSNLPDPRSPGNLTKESGRGIFIMKEYADKVIFEKNGALVHLIFNK